MSLAPRRPSACLVAAALVAVLATALAVLAPPVMAQGPDARESLDAKAAYLRGVELVRGDRSTDALPYFRAALSQRPDLWQVHADYASALFNATVETVSRRGTVGPRMRSTLERVAATNEALERFANAEQLATQPRDRAFVLRQRARALAPWGFAYEAAADERLAALDDPAKLGPIGAR